MKILFLQNMHDAIGGITNVTITLAEEFLKHEDEVYIFSIRNGGYNTIVNYPNKIHTKLINPIDEWGCPRYSQAISYLKKGKFFKCLSHLIKRIRYDIQMKKDFTITKREITTLNPDIIIVSHYELFDSIPKDYLPKTISHYHTNFDQLKNNRGQIQIFEKYKDKLGKLVWLSEQTSREAKDFGISNSTYIYNPIRFSCESESSLKSKKAVFIGRFSPEKRIRLLVDLFEEAVSNNNLSDWKLELYGVNTSDTDLMEYIEKNPHVEYMGKTESPKDILKSCSIFMLASSFEGFPLVVIEANECGIPCIAFDFGETSEEVIKKETGILIPKDDKKLYIEKLQNLMGDFEKRKKIGSNAKDFAQSFKVESIAKQWYSLFNELR